jgi:dTDP-4-dehydrorhamnose 3,5-epimerase
MMTVAHTELHNWWDGKVIIDVIKEYADDRGMLTELWRSDDPKMKNDGFDGKTVPTMSYWSVTKPMMIRGPHQHEAQTDFFITMKGRMVYQLFNPDTQEMKHFVTDPDKIYRVKVAPPIIHSYRNIQTTDITTGNFPTALFMGKNKKGYTKDKKIDEVRHEHVIEGVPTYWILGAPGRLGKSLVNTLYSKMGYHKYNIIPLYERFTNDKVGIEKIKVIMDYIIKNKNPNDVVINCIAKTNVQNKTDDFTFVNFSLPAYLTEICVKNQVHFLHFSTDYVFQNDDEEVSNYTKSKKKYEEWIESIMENPVFFDLERDDMNKYAHVIRVANLFSLDELDVHNVINKLNDRIKARQITAPDKLVVMPTCVDDVSNYLCDHYLPSIDSNTFTYNLSAKPYTIKELVEKFFKSDVPVNSIDTDLTLHTDRFLNSPRFVQLDSDVAILKKIDNINRS